MFLSPNGESALISTYSIVARDPETEQMGVGVQSKYFAVGNVVPWLEPGVGAVASQSSGDPAYGVLGLAMMRTGKSPERVLHGIVASDPGSETRQVGMVDAHGRVAAHTGSRCIPEAGHRIGEQYATQANMMLKNTVWDAMAEAYEGAKGELGERLLVALEAAEGEGGDFRGKQSVGLFVVTGKPSGTPWAERIYDLRVDDHPEPLVEMRRLLTIRQTTRRCYEIGGNLQRADGNAVEQVRRDFFDALDGIPAGVDRSEIVFWNASRLLGANRLGDALLLFRKAFELNPVWREAIPRLAKSGHLPDDSALLRRILEG